MYTPTGRPRGRPRKSSPDNAGPMPDDTLKITAEDWARWVSTQETVAQIDHTEEPPEEAPTEEEAQKTKRETLWDIDDTIDAPPPNLSYMTRDQMAGYAKRMFGRDIDPAQPVEQVRSLVRRLVSYGPNAPLW